MVPSVHHVTWSAAASNDGNLTSGHDDRHFGTAKFAMVTMTRMRRRTVARKALSVAEAKATLSDAIREVEAGGTVMITRHGKTVAAN